MFGDAEAYERFMGRWSRPVATRLVDFTGIPSRGSMLDAGSGTGSLAFAIAVATRRRGGMYEPGAVPLAILVLTLLSIATTPLQNAFVRRYEAEADWVGLNATRNPAAQRSAMRLLAVTAKSRPNPPKAEHLFEDGHPTILERIAMTKAWEERRAR